jgi:hypothetical protein
LNGQHDYNKKYESEEKHEEKRNRQGSCSIGIGVVHFRYGMGGTAWG